MKTGKIIMGVSVAVFFLVILSLSGAGFSLSRISILLTKSGR